MRTHLEDFEEDSEYGCYLFAHAAVPLLRDWVNALDSKYIGKGLPAGSNSVDNATLVAINDELRTHPIEYVGQELRGYMTDMKAIVEA